MKNEVWVKIEQTVFEKAEFRDINFIFQILSWHPKGTIPKASYFINSVEYQECDNFKKLSELDKLSLINQTSDAFTNGKNTKYKYSITNKSERKENEFFLEEAIRFFQISISLIVENSLNDSYFLKAIFKYFGHIKQNQDGKYVNVLLTFLENGWIQFVNAGGWTNIENYIEGQKQYLQKTGEKYNRSEVIYLRSFVLMDSDKIFANDYSTQNSKEVLKERLISDGVEVHILKKRAMENYMPDKVFFDAFPLKIELKPNINKFEKWINAYRHLTRVQKDYLNYQKGFPKKEIEKNKWEMMPRDEQIEGIRSLFNENLSDVNYKILDDGLKHFPKYKDEFPKFFQYNDYVNKRTLLEREGGTEEANEFLEILQKINKLL